MQPTSSLLGRACHRADRRWLLPGLNPASGRGRRRSSLPTCWFRLFFFCWSGWGFAGFCGSPARVWGCRYLGTGCPCPLLLVVGGAGAVRWLGSCGVANPAGGCKSRSGRGGRPKGKRCAPLKQGFVLAGAEASLLPPFLLCPSLPPRSFYLWERKINSPQTFYCL